MDKIVFRSLYDFVLQVEQLNSVQEEIVIIGNYQWTKDVVNSLLKNTVCTLICCDMHEPIFDNYDKEYLITLLDGEIIVEKYYVNDRYLDIYDGYDKAIMIGYGCSEKVFEMCDNDSVKIVIMDDDCEQCELRDECISEELDSYVPEDKQIDDHDCPNQSFDFYRTFPDGSEVSINVYSNDSKLIKELAETYLSEECDD